MREFNVSNNAFDFAWMTAIEDAGRHDQYEPLRWRLPTKSWPIPTTRPSNACRDGTVPRSITRPKRSFQSVVAKSIRVPSAITRGSLFSLLFISSFCSLPLFCWR
jgi:hypothetical protein